MTVLRTLTVVIAILALAAAIGWYGSLADTGNCDPGTQWDRCEHTGPAGPAAP